jgi:hypothetical protein
MHASGRGVCRVDDRAGAQLATVPVIALLIDAQSGLGRMGVFCPAASHHVPSRLTNT